MVGTSAQRQTPFMRTDPIEGLGTASSLAASLEQLPIGGLSEVVEIPQGYAFGKLEERLPFDAKAFERDRDSVRQQVLQAKQQEALIAWLEQLRSRAKLTSFVNPSGANDQS